METGRRSLGKPHTWARRRLCLPIMVLAGLVTAVLCPQLGDAAWYHKEYIALYEDSGGGAGQPFQAGADVETWAWQPLVLDEKIIYQKSAPPEKSISRRYQHMVWLTSFATLPLVPGGPDGPPGHGLPLAADSLPAGHVPVDEPWTSFVVTEDDHNIPNWAGAIVTVHPPSDTEIDIKVRNLGMQHLDAGWVKAELIGDAWAGWLADGCNGHSAASFAAVSFPGAKLYQKLPGRKLSYKLLGRNLGFGGVGIAKGNGQVRDPYFLSIIDLDTGTEILEEIMSQTMGTEDGDYSLDDTGIMLRVNRDKPDAWAELDFSTTSSWVQMPYTYGARLTPAGLTAWGETPLSGWEVTYDPDSITARYSFGEGGQPYDSVDVEVPDSLLADGHNYSVNPGTSDGAYEYLVPEPATLSLLALGGLALIQRRRR